MIRHYYYNKQIKKFIVGFANIFAGLTVRTGQDGCGDITEVEVPIRYGSADRVVSAISSSDTQNKLHTLPMMACYMTGLEIAPDRLKGVNQVDKKSFLEQGDVFPNDVKTMRRVMPIPYNMIMELAIYASSTDQMYQILEQILILFDYDLQLQFNDSSNDWTRLTKLTLTGLNNEENYPAGTERRMIVWTLSFELPVWLSPPAEIRREVIQTIMLRVGNVDDYHLDEYDAEGNLVPFLEPYSQTVISGVPDTDAADPGRERTAHTNLHYDASLDQSCSADGSQPTHEP